MTTELKLYRQAYATMTVAVYEPLIVKWFSRLSLWHIADSATKRATHANRKLTTGNLVTKSLPQRMRKLPRELSGLLEKYGVNEERVSSYGSMDEMLADMPADERRELLRAVPQLERVTTDLFEGAPARTVRRREYSRTDLKGFRGGGDDAPAPKDFGIGIPVIGGASPSDLLHDIDVGGLRDSIMKGLLDVAKAAALADKPLPAKVLRDQLLDAASVKLANKGLVKGTDFLPVLGEWLEVLSPIGIAHFYRQLYFNAGEGVGPLEEAFTIAPAETLEVVYETVRRQIHEEVVELGSESISENAVESKNLDEVSDKVSSMIQRDASAAMSSSASVSGSGGVGVWSAGASATVGASADLKSSSQRGSELASKRLKETTRRASERITKTFSIKTRDVMDITTTNLTRRIIKNDSNAPVSYGLRRVFRRVLVKVQNLGPRMVWQLYLRNPGSGLATSSFVHFMPAQPISDPQAPPAVKPRPEGGTDTGQTTASLKWDDSRETYYVTLVVRTGADRRVTAVSIDGITDLEGGGKEDINPSAKNDVQWGASFDQSTNTFTVNIGVLEGDAASVQISYSYVYEPGASVIAAWEAEKAAAQAEFEKAVAAERQKALTEQFERDKALITERSKIRPRPANDLRREERYEVMNRMISHLFASQAAAGAPEPVEIELFHRYFEIDGMFVYTHPSWWKPRYTPSTSAIARPPYQITADSEPAPMGSSLGWLLQLDGDTRRNEFLNSPWVRVCLPIQPGREREAIAWLAEHIEGEVGYDPAVDPLKQLLTDIEALRAKEVGLGKDGPDYVTVDSTVGAPGNALVPEDVYPIVDEFEVTLPTDGFVYDELKVTVP